MDAFLRDFVGYGEDTITILDIEWETFNEALNTGYGPLSSQAGRSWSTSS
jgi:hypothetical protein